MRVVKYGIAGPGSIAKRFGKAMAMVEGSEIVAVGSSNLERAKAYAEEFQVPKAYEGYEALVADEEVEVVYVATVHSVHYEIIKLCLENGKGVICEKPMVLTQAHAKELSALARQKNLLLMEAMWSRFIPTTLKAREWVKEGLIGEVGLVNATFAFHVPLMKDHRLYNPETAGGSLYDAGVYPIEFASGILGEFHETVMATASICETGVDDYVAMAVKYPSGAVATLACGFKAKGDYNGYVYGSEGHIVVENFLGSKKVERYNKDKELVESFEIEFEDGFIYEIMHCSELLREGLIESPIVTHEENMATSALFETVMEQIH